MSEPIENQLERVAARHGWKLTTRRSGANVAVVGGPRRQNVRVRFHNGNCQISSTVVSGLYVKADDAYRRELAELAWRRNAEGELVTFGFDARERLVAHVRHPMKHLDEAELEVYLLAVAREADRFEYLVSGEDRY